MLWLLCGASRQGVQVARGAMMRVWISVDSEVSRNEMGSGYIGEIRSPRTC